jgi:hypothetical protein
MTTVSPNSPKRTIYAINAAGGAIVAIPATAASRKVVITECPPGGGTFNDANFAPQGLNYQLPNDGFVTIYPLLPADSLVLGNLIAEGKGAGPLQGYPAQQDPGGRTIPAFIYAKIISATATATQVMVLEYA